MAIATLPYPSMDFTPLDVLTADELDQIVANIEAINNATINTGAIANGAVATAKIADGAVSTNKVADGAITGAKIDFSTITSAMLEDIPFATATATDYITFTVGKVNTQHAYRFGNIVIMTWDISNVGAVNGQKTIGSASSKLVDTFYGAGRISGGSATIPATLVAIPNGEVRLMTTGTGTGTAGTIWLLVND